MVGPYQEAKNRDGHTGKCHKRISKNTLAREAGHDLADNSHARQDHDVDSRMGVEPEHVLEEHGIAAQFGIETTNMKAALQGQKNERNGQDRRSQHHDQAGCVV